jgi:hypothetical protein
MPAPSRALLDGQCATPVPGRGEPGDRGVVEVHGVRHPDVVAEPAQRVDVLGGGRPEPRLAERLLVVGLGQVGVQPHAVPAGERGGLGHQLSGDRER